MERNPGRKRYFRFSVGDLLFFMLCLAGFLSGYRFGFRKGGYTLSRVRVVGGVDRTQVVRGVRAALV